ncbi:uncharacterized protein L969DRAFT_92041 [Mixia osmundae IAM 14324]|uniref:Required for respiratory growth protein 7, mitochondrial n=1 Tax=Mixia osmundae (strain CBS 9802 / IAM 14324 / JCM 22182 / KY 12970) TaxID=764103 RepID=G7DZB8_MIXOS|nr:uncharacterized protein L969DRAFT_92041 [Mixia osmundae IAM 14324]KEI42606.1 hypothetical protein L969DRAFT_92041 [Mixia osmundae IAM 14324]GAA95928.1 hypothetical protein E5Q_02586 [Mixia osmundae IAM 14324]
MQCWRCPVRFSAQPHRSARRLQSTVARGTAYEELCQRYLNEQWGMSLMLVGGRNDRGVDLRGYWSLPLYEPSSDDTMLVSRRVRILGQCKAERKRLGPRVIRELEGTLGWEHLALGSTVPTATGASQPTEDEQDVTLPTIAVLLSLSGFTPATLSRTAASPLPVLCMHIEYAQSDEPATLQDEQQTGKTVAQSSCRSALWNAAAQRVLGPAFEIRWHRSMQNTALANTEEMVERPRLYWNGREYPSTNTSQHANANAMTPAIAHGAHAPDSARS